MSRTKLFLYNSLTTAILQIVTMIFGFIIPRIMLIYYGSEINGLVSSITQFISYFSLVEAGLSGATIYALYKPISDNDYDAINAVLSATKKFYNQSGYIFVSLTIGLACIFPFFVTTNSLSSLDVFLLVLILGINGSLEFFTLSKYRALLSADQRTYIISLASIAHLFLNTIIIIIFAMLRVDIVLLRFLALTSIFLRTYLLTLYCKRKYPYINYNVTPNKKALNKRWDALLLQILGTIHTGAPIIIITLLTNDLKLVSVYTVFNMVISGLNGILSIFMSGLGASFGHLIAKNEIKVLQNVYSEFEFLYYSLISVIYATAFKTIMPFINIYTSGIDDINYNVPILGFLFVLNGLLYNLKTPQGMLVISAGLYKETKLQTIIQGLIAVVGGIILTPYLGIAGVVLSSIVSNLYRTIVLVYFIAKNVTKLPIKTTIYRYIQTFVNISIVLYIFSFVKYNPTNILAWGIYACLVGIFSLILVFISGLIFERKEFKSFTLRVKGLVGGKNG